MQTPLKLNIRKLKIHSLKFSSNKFFIYSVYTALSILLGSILQIILPISRSTLGKASLITGLPFLRSSFFFFPIILSVGAFTWTCIIFKDSKISELVDGSVFKYLNKIRMAYVITNSSLLAYFYFIYYYLYLPLWDSHEFKLSGHILACLFSIGILTNLINLCEMFKHENIKKELMMYAINACKFFIFHNIYCILWTSWVFHRIRETVISYIIGILFVLIINLLGLDKLVIFLLDNKLPSKFNGKEKNKIYEKDYK
jgi:hypothetical protein